MDAIKSRVKYIQEESNELTRYVNALPPDALKLPSACSRWEVGDVIAHWIWFIAYYPDFIVSRALRGDLSPLPDQPEVGTGAALDEFHAMRAIVRRADLGDQLRDTFTRLVEEMNARFAELSQEDWQKPMRLLSGIATIETVLGLAIQEFPLHGWDICSRLEESANLSVEGVLHLMAWIPQRFRMPWFVEFLPDKPLASSVLYRFDIPQAATDLTVVDNKLKISTAAETTADVTFHCDAETFVLLMYKRLTLRQASEGSRLAADSDDNLIASFDQWLER